MVYEGRPRKGLFLSISEAFLGVFLGERGLRRFSNFSPRLSPVRPGRGMEFDFCQREIGGELRQCSDVAARWRQYAGCELGVARVFVVGSHVSDGRMASLARFFSLEGLGVDHCDDFGEALRAIGCSPSRWSLLVIDLDHAEHAFGIQDVVDELVDFRDRFSEIAVVLLSHGFARDDCSLTRSSIADHCFRASVGNEVVFSALPHVFDNHQAWIRRRKELGAVVVPFSSGERNEPIP